MTSRLTVFTILSFLVFPSLSYAAETPSSWLITGHMQTRYENRTSSSFFENFDKNVTLFRLRTNIVYQPSSALSIHVSPQAIKAWGADFPSGALSSGGVRHPEIQFFEAFLKYNLTSRLSLMVGRRGLSFGNELVVGTLGWANGGRSFDGVSAVYEGAKIRAEGFFSQISDSGETNLQSNDHEFAGAYLEFHGQSVFDTLESYLLYNDQPMGNLHFGTLGLRTIKTIQMVHLGFEGSYQFGSSLSNAYQGDGFLGLKGNHWAFHVGYSLAGENYEQLFPTAHKFLGFADLFGRRNIQALRVHSSGQVIKGLKLSWDLHYFQRFNSDEPVYGLVGQALGNATESNSNELGVESDLVLTYSFMGSSRLQLGWAAFQPGDYFQAQTAIDLDKYSPDQAGHFVYTQLITNF